MRGELFNVNVFHGALRVTRVKDRIFFPIAIGRATMVFIDSYGNQLKTVQLTQTGNGTLNVAPDNLAAGIYSYSLVVNGKVIDTKRMILQK